MKKKRKKTTEEPKSSEPYYPNLTLLTLFETFLRHNNERKFLVWHPYDTPIGYMLQQLTGWAWKVDESSIHGPESEDCFFVPPWMAKFTEALKEKEGKSSLPEAAKTKKKAPQLVMTGAQLRQLLLKAVRGTKKTS